VKNQKAKKPKKQKKQKTQNTHPTRFFFSMMNSKPNHNQKAPNPGKNRKRTEN